MNTRIQYLVVQILRIAWHLEQMHQSEEGY